MVQKSVQWLAPVTEGRPKWSQQVPLGTKRVPNNARLSKVGTNIITIEFPMGGLPLSFIYIYIYIYMYICIDNMYMPAGPGVVVFLNSEYDILDQ